MVFGIEQRKIWMAYSDVPDETHFFTTCVVCDREHGPYNDYIKAKNSPLCPQCIKKADEKLSKDFSPRADM